MMDSVLDTIKKMLGLDYDYDQFDQDIIVLINTVLMSLSQIGVVSASTSITSSEETWSDILSDRTDIESVKTYIYLKVRDVFDPPSSSAVADALHNTISELEWRLSVRVDKTNPV